MKAQRNGRWTRPRRQHRRFGGRWMGLRRGERQRQRCRTHPNDEIQKANGLKAVGLSHLAIYSRPMITAVLILCMLSQAVGSDTAKENTATNPDVLSTESVSEIKRAAENGDTQAEVKLALAFDKGNGVMQDDGQAAQWYRKAANSG